MVKLFRIFSSHPSRHPLTLASFAFRTYNPQAPKAKTLAGVWAFICYSLGTEGMRVFMALVAE